ncbi:hypothetical protein [Reyranella sp.]|uniref:hypothetical protein n=1 Tax=Reyranella sp. TaxID=1929291 RepID=UPI00121DB987|nr:hypothetical protein [Reyranella sp.]TAJ89732.1 MAG: hypothetical protein EPO50_05035 [Reyranella sp.]
MNRQHLDVFAGENRTPTLYARDPSNNVASLAGKTVSWRVGRSPRDLDSSWPIFTKTGTVVDAAAGSFTVPITPADTQYLYGDYEHQAVTTDGSGNAQVVVAGIFRVRPRIEA